MNASVEQNNLFDGQQLRAPRYYGKYPALVTDNAPPSDGNHRGEVMVQVPGILEETSDGDGQQPIEVIARPCFAPGFFFVPEIGAQVWVEFAAGDIDMPLWTGVWYPRDGVPKTSADDAPTEFKKIYRTAADHVIELDNTDGEEQIVIKHKSATAITIDPDGNVIIEHNGGAKFEIKDGNTVEITADTINAIGEITLDGEVHITGNTNIDGELTVGMGPSTTISGNEIKGG